MADNTVLNTGSGGDTIATDDISGVKHQRVKVEFGADGSATDVSSANPLPVAQTGALPAGTAAIGKLAANSGVDIGDVDVTSSALPTGASTSAKQPALGTAGSASADVLTVQGVTSMTPLLVNGSGVTQPVSGTVTATGPLTDTQLRATAVPVSGTVTASGPVTDTQLRASAVPVSLATLPALVAGTAAIGKLAANTGVIIGDVNLVSAVPAGTNNIGFATVTPGTTGGWSKIKYAAQTTTVVKPKGTAGTFGGYFAYNPNASVAYIQVFDLATATTVTLGTTVPDMIFAIPAGAAANLEITNGVNMALGMQLACATTAGGSTAPGTGLDLTIFFK